MTDPSSRVTTNVDVCVEVLSSGGLVAIPTETVYGLAALATNEAAVKNVFLAKGRPLNHPLIVHLGPSSHYEDWGVFNEQAKLLAKAFWPGPLTLLVQRTSRVLDLVTGGRDSVALRVPAHPLTQRLLDKLNDGVVAPSANRFGKVSPTTAQHVVDDLGEDVDAVLDGGTCDFGVESTIVDCTGDVAKILRPGVITVEQIRDLVGKVETNDVGESRAPGMLASHYAPNAVVELFETFNDAQLAVQRHLSDGDTSVLLHFEDVDEYAANLYAFLRSADKGNIQYVCAVLPPGKGVGLAIRDRIRKAAYRG